MIVLGYLASIFMGLVLGLTGGGGSILTVPILVYLFQINPVLATTYSLFIVGLTALVGGISYFRKGEVDLKTGSVFVVPSFLGVYLTRTFVIPSLPDPVLKFDHFEVSKAILIMFAFAVLMVLASFSMIKDKKENLKESTLSNQLKIILVILQGFVVGCVTGFVGAGGGFLIIPALVVLVGIPMKKAVGTSLVIIAINSLIGFLSGLKNQIEMDWRMLFILSVLALTGLTLGLKLNQKIPAKTLKKGFGFFVLIMGSFIILDQIRKYWT